MKKSYTSNSTVLHREYNHDIVNKIYFFLEFHFCFYNKKKQEAPPSSIISWTTNDVEQWLKSLNFSNFIDRFCKQNGIDGLTLLLMKEDDLKQPPLSIERLCDIKKLWYHIRLLQCKDNDCYSILNNEKTKYNNHSPIHLLEKNNSYQIHNQNKSIFKSLKGEKFKTFVSFIYALISGIWTSFIMVVVHNRVPNVQK
jgi:hypothetical protein